MTDPFTPILPPDDEGPKVTPPQLTPDQVTHQQVSPPQVARVAPPPGRHSAVPPRVLPPVPLVPPRVQPRAAAAPPEVPAPGRVGEGRAAAPAPPAPLVAGRGPVGPPRYSDAPIGPSGSPELLRQAMTRRQEPPAQKGWRRAIRSMTGGRIKPGPGSSEAAARAELELLRSPFGRPMTVLVANPKGGAGKTPTTLMLGASLGQARGGYVLAWDNNETRGTLGLRAHQHRPASGVGTTVWDLLSVLDHFETVDASVGALSRFVRPQETLFDVLASDEDAARMAQIGREEVRRLHRLMARFYRVIVVDTGNNLRAPNWQAISEVADVLVVVSTYEWDTAYSASWMLDHLCAQGRGDLVARAVTVLTSTDRRVQVGTRDELIRAFDRTATVVEIPYDQGLRGGGEIAHGALREDTRNAWSAVAAAVCRQLGALDAAAAPAPSFARAPVIGGVPLGGLVPSRPELSIAAAEAAPAAAAPVPAQPEPTPEPEALPTKQQPLPAKPSPPPAVPPRQRIGPTVHLDLSGLASLAGAFAPAGGGAR